MFKCNICDRTFRTNNFLLRHLGSKEHTNNIPSTSNVNNNICDQGKRRSNSSKNVSSKKQKLETADDTLIPCEMCKMNIKKSLLHAHKRTNAHKDACSVIYKQNNIELITSSFASRISSYKVKNNNEEELNVDQFLENIRQSVCILINEHLLTQNNLKVNVEFFGSFILEKADSFEFGIKSFNTKNEIICLSTILSDVYEIWKTTIKTKSDEFNERSSGWRLLEILHLEININKYKPLHGSSYIDLPDKIKAKKAVINIKNDDNKCFAYAINSALNPTNDHPCRVSSYPNFHDHLNFDGIEFPIKFKDIHKFEKQNNISVNVFGLNEKGDKLMGPLHHTTHRQSTHINLLYLEHGVTSHFCWIKNLSALVSSQLSKKKNRKYICDGCLQYFRKETQLRLHQEEECIKVRTILPSKGKVTKKKNIYI